MTEAEWLVCKHPEPMVKQLGPKAKLRKLRLFAVSCCWRIRHLFTDSRSKKAVKTAALYADGDVSDSALLEIHNAAYYAVSALEHQGQSTAYHAAQAATWVALPSLDSYHIVFVTRPAAQAMEGALADADRAKRIANPGRWMAGRSAELAEQANLVRDIFGNPFRPVALDPSWLTWRDGTIPQIAQVIYDERRFSELPILADALEEAGCTNAEILNHCREPGEHVRGCWVVDLLLGKE